MSLAKIICAFAGHDWQRLESPPGYLSGMGAPRECMRCGHSWPGIKFPPMPPMRAPKPDPDPITLKIDIDTSAIDAATVRMERLVALSKQVDVALLYAAIGDAQQRPSEKTPDPTPASSSAARSTRFRVEVFTYLPMAPISLESRTMISVFRMPVVSRATEKPLLMLKATVTLSPDEIGLISDGLVGALEKIERSL